jgi:hypothetical protein
MLLIYLRLERARQVRRLDMTWFSPYHQRTGSVICYQLLPSFRGFVLMETSVWDKKGSPMSGLIDRDPKCACRRHPVKGGDPCSRRDRNWAFTRGEEEGSYDATHGVSAVHEPDQRWGQSTAKRNGMPRDKSKSYGDRFPFEILHALGGEIAFG